MKFSVIGANHIEGWLFAAASKPQAEIGGGLGLFQPSCLFWPFTCLSTLHLQKNSPYKSLGNFN